MKRILRDGRADWGHKRRRDDAPASAYRDGTSAWRRMGNPFPRAEGLPWLLAPDGEHEGGWPSRQEIVAPPAHWGGMT
jgi:hypothetical protein